MSTLYLNGKFLAQRFDIRAFFADDHARTGGIDRHTALFVRTFDDHLRDAGCFAVFMHKGAHFQIFQQQVAVIFRFSEPAAVPGAVDLQAHADRIDLLTHYADSPA
jgi:hypothetical protein